MPELADKLAEYAINLKFSDLSEKTIHETKRRLIDTLGCGIAVFKEPSVAMTRDVAKYVSSKGRSTLLGTRIKSSPDHATFNNAYSTRYLDWMDTYLSKEPAHPSDNIASILAVAEAEESTGKDVILATVLAYEIQCRLCDAASLRARGWDHVNYLLVSSALSASKLMGLDAEKMAQAVKIALNDLSTRQNRVGELSNWKAAACANATRNGVFASMLASRGFTGPFQIFEGRWGFQNQLSGPFDLDLESFGRKGGDFMLDATYIKKHDAEYHSQSAVDAALELRKNIKSIGDVESVLVETHEAGFTIIGHREKEPEKWDPKTRETADHSMPYIVAIALMDGEVTEKQYEVKRFRDKKTLAFLDRITVVEKPEFTKAYAKDGIINKITIKLKDGRAVSKQVGFPRGHPKNPMSDKEVEDKFGYLAGSVLKKNQVGGALKFLWKFEKAKDMNELFKLFVIDK